MIKYFLFLYSIFSFSLSAVSQSKNPLRIEVASDKIEDIYSLPMQNKHLFVVEHLKKRGPKGEHWIIEIYDSKMKRKGNKVVYLPRNFGLFDYKLLGDSVVWMCFAEADGERSSLMLYRINVSTLYMKHIYIKGSRKSKLNRIEVLNNKVFIIGENMQEIKSQTQGLKLPYGIKIITATIPDNTKIIASRTSIVDNSLMIIVKGRKGEDNGVFMYEYAEDNGAFSKIALPAANTVNIIDGKLIEGSSGDLLFMGTYSKSFGRQITADNITVEGTYLGKLHDGNLVFFKINEFSDFKNVYSTLDYKTAIKAKQKKSKGKDVDLSFKLLVHDKYFKQGGKYIMIAESYYPEYHYENNFDTRGYMYQTEVFDGYKTTNCIVAAFDEYGSLVWDNYMHITDISSYVLQENIMVFPEDDSSIVMAYYSDGYIISKIVNGNDVVFKKSKDKIETVFQENVIDEELGHIEAWYDKYFIVSGHQIVIGRNSKKRKIFFFNLISFD